MLVLIGNKNNIYSYAINTTAKTITISNLIAFDLNVNSLSSVWDVNTSAFIPPTAGMTCTKVVVAGLPTWVYTYSSFPAATANGDTLNILINIAENQAVYSLLEYIAGATI